MNIKYDVFQVSDLAEMAFVLGETFSRGEPMASALGMMAKDIESLVMLFASKAVAELVSVIARNSDGRMVGALLAQDFAGPPPDGMEQITPLFHPRRDRWSEHFRWRGPRLVGLTPAGRARSCNVGGQRPEVYCEWQGSMAYCDL